jgi:hypothetical protein
MKTVKMIVWAFMLSSTWYAQNKAWTSLYAIDVAKRAMDHRSFFVERTLSLPATQLLFSWNAWRPRNGSYIFYVQVRPQGATRWSDWYKIAEWGSDVQRSFERLMDGAPSFCYVRFEMPAGMHVQECRIKVEATGNASVRDIARLSVTAVDYDQFVPEAGKGKTWTLSPVKIGHIPQFSQMQTNHADRERMCSPTSLAMVVSYLLNKTIDPLKFAQGVYDDGLHAYGSWPFNVAHAFNVVDGRYYFAVTRLTSFAQLYSFLQRRLPVVVSVRGPMRSMPHGRTYADGHLLVVIGWDSTRKRVIVLDPAFETNQAVLHSYDIDDFLAAWERSYRLAYIAEPVG